MYSSLLQQITTEERKINDRSLFAYIRHEPVSRHGFRELYAEQARNSPGKRIGDRRASLGFFGDLKRKTVASPKIVPIKQNDTLSGQRDGRQDIAEIVHSLVFVRHNPQRWRGKYLMLWILRSYCIESASSIADAHATSQVSWKSEYGLQGNTREEYE
ncbi:MAG: hypothetical protein RL681_821, partial [Candidatus Parcubacteria bacterium]